jgi:spermidine/putrescine transport system ATP-binding protein
MANYIVSIQNATKWFGQTLAVDNLSLGIIEGELVTLLGPSGCGKTTLLRIIAGLEEATSGRVEIAGQNMEGFPPHKRPVNMVFQKYALFPHLDVFENIAFGLRLKRLPEGEIDRKVKRMLELVRLPGFERRRTAQLSGGESQRVALARALVMEPKVLLLDEPLGALDLKIRQQLEIELKRIHAELGTTFLYVTHDQGEAMTVSNRIAIMNDGHLVQVGTPQEIYNNPNCTFCASFVGESNILTGRVTGFTPESTLVDVEGLTIRARLNEEAAEGQTVNLLIRPEVLSVGADREGHDNLLQGKLVDVTFLGSSVTYRIDTNGEKPLQVEQAVKEGTRLFRRGNVVSVGWSARDTLVLLE